MDRPKILLIDDDVQLVALLRELLESRGYDADVAYDGETGAEKALRDRYHLIILDLMMPLKDGFAVLSRDQSETRYARHYPDREGREEGSDYRVRARRGRLPVQAV